MRHGCPVPVATWRRQQHRVNHVDDAVAVAMSVFTTCALSIITRPSFTAIVTDWR